MGRKSPAGTGTDIKLEKRLSANTVESYMRDLEQFAHFVLRMWDVPPRKVESRMIERYMAWLYDRGCGEEFAGAARLSGSEKFFQLSAAHRCDREFALGVHRDAQVQPPAARRAVDRRDRPGFFAAIDRTTPKGVRDDAMLELLYSCGLRVSELISLRLCDLFFGEGYIRVIGKGDKQRLVPVSDTAREKIYV